MLGLLVVSHGRFAEELVHATRKIVAGSETLEALEAISMGWNDDLGEATTKIQQAVERVDRGAGVLVLTDMFGGTPTNVALSLLEAGRIEIVTGVNLPMLIKFTNLRTEMTLKEAAAEIASQGRESIHVASELLESAGEAGENGA